MQTILNHLLEILVAGLSAIVLAFWTWLAKQFNNLPKLALSISQKALKHAKDTEGKGDDMAWGAIVALLEVIVRGTQETVGTRASDQPGAVSTVNVRLENGKVIADRRAPEVDREPPPPIICGKPAPGGTGKCTKLLGHPGACESTPMVKSIFPHHLGP